MIGKKRKININSHEIQCKIYTFHIKLKDRYMFSVAHLHPMLVHFPIAIVLVGFLADFIQVFIKKEQCFSKMGFYLLIAGTLAAIVTVLSGFLFTPEMSGVIGEVRETHEHFAVITVLLLIAASVLRTMVFVKKIENKRLTWLIFAIYALAAITVSITGFLGGNLVYTYLMPM